MARPPDRRHKVYFLGAGFSRAAGLPSTAELLNEIHGLRDTPWGVSNRIVTRLEDAYRYFYPEPGTSFRPDIVDFFSVLTTYGYLDRGKLPDGFKDKRLLADLRDAIAQVLCSRIRGLRVEAMTGSHELLDEMISQGNIVVTSNWDSVVERLCEVRGVQYRLCGIAHSSYLLLLKLHGSIDWLERANAKKPVSISNYANLTELISPTRDVRPSLTHETVLRVRVRRPGAVWQTIKGASSAALMITMAPSKAPSLEPLIHIWEQAYKGLSAAEKLYIVGYSMPSDDIEIRTLIRAGIERGPHDPRIVIRNPSPEVHVRARELLNRAVESDYRAIDCFT